MHHVFYIYYLKFGLMNFRLSFCSFILFFLTCISASTAQINQITAEEQADGWKLLFDGTSTKGWKGFNRQDIPAGWQAENGCLMTTGRGGDRGGEIITTDNFEDFDLYLEWAISPGGNSGIFFHVLEGNYPSAYATGPEYQLIDDEGYPDKLEEWQMTGADYAMHNADKEKKHLKPVGEFNSSRIRVQDGVVIHWLNGEKIVEYELWTKDWYDRVENSKWKEYPSYGKARKGHIGLQDHGSPVYFRNIKIKDLADYGKPLFNGVNLVGWTIHGKEKWYADNGMLTGESGEGGGYGYLSTTKNYNDFILRLQFKIEGPGNSGVFFRSQLKGTDITGWQVEVAPPGEDTGGIYESGGRGWLAQIPDDKEGVLKDGDWNDLVIFLKGDRVMTWLNGAMMTDLTDSAVGKGKGIIALQIHSGGSVKVLWKDVILREL